MGQVAPTILAGLGLFAVAIGSAPEAPAQQVDNAAEYTACMNTARSDPEAAFDKATAWRGLGGGEAAEHCAAAALFALGQYQEAAMRFAKLALETQRNDPFRAELLGQSAQAWLQQGNMENAESTLTTAIRLAPAKADLRIDRSVVRALQKKFADALSDLDTAILLAPVDPEAYALRAGAHRLLGDLDAALADANRSLSLDPNRPEGLLERGFVHRQRGEKDAARRDWLRLIEVAPETEAAKAARANIEEMDVEGSPGR